MFTGIVKATGEVARIDRRGGDLRFAVRCDAIDWEQYSAGESIAVNGVCLTAVAFSKNGFEADVSTETMRVTALDQLESGSPVNLEPALTLKERLGGHLVNGHIDCIGNVVTRNEDARSLRLEIEIPAEFSRYVAHKGSICVDGVSLTINSVSGPCFAVNIIPHTRDSTIIRGYRVGSAVNIEVDLLARYLERLLATDTAGGITKEYLREHGYV